MYFGLTNSPATFQTMMNDLFWDLINQGDTATFIDDILVATDTKEGHDELVNEVLRRLEENDLFVKLEKCKWKVREVEFLGVVIGPKGVEMQKEKVEGVLNWPAPRNIKEIQKFLGLANYYRRFIKDFARIAAPLHMLVRKEQKWKWEKEQEEAFGKLKAVFTMELVLVIPDIDREMRVEADASDYATGGVLSVKCENGKWRPVVFISKSLNTTERNYKIHNKEMLAVIRCLEAWRHYLEGEKLEFEIWTDHKNLQYFMTSQKLNQRQVQWALYLSRFNFTLKHVPGKSMGKADGLSRRPDWQEGVERDNEDRTLIKPEWVRGAETIVEEGNLKERIKKVQEGDEKVVKVVEELKKAGIKTLKDEEWEIENGVVLKKGRIYVPEGELREEVIWLHHDTPVGRHGERWKMTELVTRNYWWPGVTKEVEKYVEGCNACQRYKNRSEVPAGKLMPNAIPEKPWSHISADFITKLPLAQEYDAILVVCDRFSKMAHFIATTEKTSVEGLAKLFRDQVWRLHGLPKSIISDRGVQFAAGMMKELNNLLGIQTKLFTAYHPQTDRQTERVNQELEQYLRVFIDHRQEQWPDWLGTAEFAYNNKIHTTTKISPFRVNYGQDPRMGFEGRRKGKYEVAEKFIKKMKKIQEEVKAALGKAQEEMKKFADRKRGKGKEYRVGDLVLLSTKDLKWQMKGRRSEKLTERFVGPYKIKEIISSNTVELDLPKSIRIHPIVNISRVRLYKPQVERQKKIPLKPVIIKEEEEFEVEKILNKRIVQGKEKFLV